MLVMKFGGTSMGSAERMRNAVEIIRERSSKDRVAVIVSAVGGVSNRLEDGIRKAVRLATASAQTTEDPVVELVSFLRTTHDGIVSTLSGGKAGVSGFDNARVSSDLETLYAEAARLLGAVVDFGECPESVECRIMGLGERFCVPIMAELLRSSGEDLAVLDSREIIVTEGSLREGEPLLAETEARLAPFRSDGARVILAPGFVASSADGRPSLLGRNGSDFSAALFAMGLAASRLEIWSDVDGIYTADPRIVADAILVPEISYEEAMELSFFGSKVLHPKTIAPVAARGIETWSLNSMNRSAPGTRIAASGSIAPAEAPVRGITALKGTALVSVSGAGLKGKRGVAARVFSAVSRSGASALLITQSSSEYTISFCVRGTESAAVERELRAEFALELREGLVDGVSVIQGMSIVSIVGDGMKRRKGVAGTFFSALAFAGINVQAIAQGSSERSISAVVADADGDKAVRVAHRFFFETMQTVEVFLFGVGVVGGKLLEQIRLQAEELRRHRVDVRVLGIANSRRMVLSPRGIDLARWRDGLASADAPSSVDGILEFARAEKPLNPVFVDCTSTEALPLRYPEILSAGMHIATPNKKGNSLSMGFYREIRAAAIEGRKRFLYETNVGAGLPVIDTFRNMLKSGDRLIHFSGVLSGSLSYIFGRLDEGASFSAAVLEARAKGFTEPDPRDDLSGADVARKALIVAREAGAEVELADVRVDPVFPADFDLSGTVDEFLARLPAVDPWFADRVSTLRARGKVLRFAAHITGGDPDAPRGPGAFGATARVGLLEVDLADPLAAIKGGENAFVFTTKYYSPIPLVIRGYGAGADVTASGIFADILRTTSW